MYVRRLATVVWSLINTDCSCCSINTQLIEEINLKQNPAVINLHQKSLLVIYKQLHHYMCYTTGLSTNEHWNTGRKSSLLQWNNSINFAYHQSTWRTRKSQHVQLNSASLQFHQGSSGCHIITVVQSQCVTCCRNIQIKCRNIATNTVLNRLCWTFTQWCLCTVLLWLCWYCGFPVCTENH